MLCLERHCPGHCSRCPDVRKVYTLEKVLEYCFAQLVCLNNRNDLTAKLRELSNHIRRVSPTPLSHLHERGRKIFELAGISENIVEIEIRHDHYLEAGLGTGESLLETCDWVYGFFSSRHASKLQSIGLTIRS